MIKLDFIGITSIIIAVIILAFTVQNPRRFTLSELKALFIAPPFLAYIGLQLVTLLYIVCFCIEKKQSSSAIKIAQQKRLSMSTAIRNSAKNNIPMYYAAMSGIIGAFSMLLGKCTAEMVVQTFHGEKPFTDPLSILIVIGLAVTIVFQTRYLNVALMLGEVMVVFPIFQVFWIVFSVLGGIIFYDEMVRFTATQVRNSALLPI